MQIDHINKDDYFVKNAEFTTWLREHRSKFFNELDSNETRALFGERCTQISNCNSMNLAKAFVYTRSS